ncbi:FG-GAP-like repeat-containing protein [Pelagibaculum spongiae]|uniref:VCBS repeat-containing protein n=1 Tax=Pelagibaculum spongiae TaxID=2080658 RepID=A0A2V1H336_9GAMM|nr:FG-GAP-like repeat-containing protein [Pelagibaculum spongiae]PVZ72390.1 hypothetical protein DC094_05130 [Pelagibaculum spongiae]
MIKQSKKNNLLPISGGIFLVAGLISASDTFALTLVNDTFAIDEDTPAIFDVLSNDQVSAGETINAQSLTIISAPQNGRAIIENGKIVYQSTQDFNGSDSLSYQITDSNNAVKSASVAINIASVNDRPVQTSAELIHVQQNQSYTYQATATDVDNTVNFQFGWNSGASFTSLGSDSSSIIFSQQRIGLHSIIALRSDHASSIIRVVSHGNTADPSVTQQLPALAANNQQQTLNYLISNENPYFSQNTELNFSAKIIGAFAVNQIPESCTQNSLSDDLAGIAISCDNLTLDAAEPLQLSVRITPSTAGFIDSTATLSATTGEARSNNNISSQRLAVLADTVSVASQQVTADAAASITAVDAEGDGDIDLLVAPADYGQPIWFLNDGTGRVAQAGTLFGAIDAIKVLTADLDNDGINEIILLNRDGAVQQYSRINGSYQLTNAISEWDDQIGSVFARDAQVADLNGDQYPELVIAGNYATPIFPNNNGILGSAISFRNTGINNHAVAIADFNNDQQADIIYPSALYSTKRWLNNGDSDLNNNLTRQFWSGSYPLSLYKKALAVDLNSDNHDDLVLHTTGERNSSNLYRELPELQTIHQLRIFNNGQSGLSNSVSRHLDIPEIDSFNSFDFDNDSDQDLLLATEQGAGILLNNQQGNLNLGGFAIQSQPGNQFVIADLNNDGYNDLITASITDAGIQSYINPLGDPLAPITTDENNQNDRIGLSISGSGSLNWGWIIALLLSAGSARRNKVASRS